MQTLTAPMILSLINDRNVRLYRAVKLDGLYRLIACVPNFTAHTVTK